MRKIKFRIWDESQNKMFDPFIFDNDFDCTSGWLYQAKLMQFTGLEDKNGKEIFEGDIIQSLEITMDDPDDPIWFVDVVFEGASFTYGEHGDALEESECKSEMEIIGNIYENPELVEHLRKYNTTP